MAEGMEGGTSGGSSAPSGAQAAPMHATTPQSSFETGTRGNVFEGSQSIHTSPQAESDSFQDQRSGPEYADMVKTSYAKSPDHGLENLANGNFGQPKSAEDKQPDQQEESEEDTEQEPKRKKPEEEDKKEKEDPDEKKKDKKVKDEKPERDDAEIAEIMARIRELQEANRALHTLIQLKQQEIMRVSKTNPEATSSVFEQISIYNSSRAENDEKISQLYSELSQKMQIAA